MGQRATLSERALILAPLGRDAEIAAAILMEAGIAPDIQPDLPGLSDAVAAGAGLALIADEAVLTADLRPLTKVLERQSSWSDFPIVLMTRGGGGPEKNPAAARLAELLGNVTFVERPFHPTTLVSVVRSAIRSRRRQYDARTTLQELAQRQTDLANLTATLEQRVEERTRRLQESEAALRQAQKMEVMGQLTGGVAHDFNNLLMAIMGNLDLLRKQHLGDLKSSRLIEGAMQGAERGAALTRRMLAFARQQELQTHSISLKSLLSEMENLLERSLGPEFELKLDLADVLPPAEVDGNQIELAVLNLVINARDAMPGGGTITVAADYPPTIPDGLPPGNFLRLSVRDSGIGMDPETLKRAVEPFFSTKGVGKGTGLGLSMVHGLAVQHGGLFELESVEGKGTTATLWLPTAHRPAVQQHPKTAATSVPYKPSRKATILVVDDDMLISMATVDMLEDLGHTVIEANSGKQALEVLASGKQIDVMMTDHAMPGMTGAELADLARRQRPDLPILLATGYADLPPGQKFNLPRLSKPYHQDALRAEIEKLLPVESK